MASRDPPWSQPGGVGRLVLVAHYDSKISPEGFIGATDSAAPCAMLMHAASAIDKALTKKWKHMEEQRKKVKQSADEELEDDKYTGSEGDIWNRGIMILLLDGEEAFEAWTDDDSLYGARLALPSAINRSLLMQEQEPGKCVGVNISYCRLTPPDAACLN